MKRIIQLGTLIVMVAVCPGLSYSPADAHQGVDSLIASVNSLHQSGDITDVKIMANLVVSLQTIGNLLDSGNSNTGKSLLTAFITEVESLNGGGLNAAAVQTLKSGATNLAAAL